MHYPENQNVCEGLLGNHIVGTFFVEKKLLEKATCTYWMNTLNPESLKIGK